MSHHTIDSIEASFAAADKGAILLDLPRRKVFRLDKKIIKFGKDIDIHEAEAMLFVAANLDIPVPKVLKTETYDGTTLIEMQLIAGRTLQEVWPSLSHEDKESIAKQLNIMIEKMRSIQGAYIGSLQHGPAIDMRISVARGGPFDCEADFNVFLLGNTVRKTPKIHHHMLRTVMSTEHRIVLTHGDLNPHNILIEDAKIVGLLDWEAAGFYPEYWEFVQFFRNIDSSVDWYEYANSIFTQTYPQEYMNNHFLGRFTKH